MANRVSNDQLEELLDFLAEHPALAKGVGLGGRSKETVDKQWDSLAAKLNSYGSGSSKSGERWKRYWADIKHKTKARLAKRRRYALGTGGGPSIQDDLSETDRKILAIIGEQTIHGDRLESPVARPHIDRPHKRKRPFISNTVQSRIDLEWIKELESRRVEAETKLAEATLIMAESSRTQAEVAKVQADMMQTLVDLIRVQNQDVRALIELTRVQAGISPSQNPQSNSNLI